MMGKAFFARWHRSIRPFGQQLLSVHSASLLTLSAAAAAAAGRFSRMLGQQQQQMALEGKLIGRRSVQDGQRGVIGIGG